MAKDDKSDLGLFPNISRLGYRPILKSPSFRYLLYGKRRKVGPRSFPEHFSSRLSTNIEKSEFSLFVVGQKTKSLTSDFFQTFLVYVIDIYLEKSQFLLSVIEQKTKSRTSDISQTFLVHVMDLV